MQENHIQHYGVKGQKWSLRKYQNSDGSLTETGRLRYGKGPAPTSRSEAKYRQKKTALEKKEATREALKASKSSGKKLSEEEVWKRIGTITKAESMMTPSERRRFRKKAMTQGKNFVERFYNW